MADVVTQKREARRRRILANSENRLKRITGLYGNDGILANSDDFNETQEETVSISSVPNKKSVTKEPEIFSNVESHMESPTAPENVPFTDESLWKHTNTNIETSSTVSDPTLSSETILSVLPILCLNARLHIIVLAVVVRVLLMLQCGTLFGESAVVPLFSLEVVDWFNVKLRGGEPQNPPSGLLGMALMLSGMAPQKVSHLISILGIFNQLSQDFCIYFFVFSLTHVFLQLFTSS